MTTNDERHEDARITRLRVVRPDELAPAHAVPAGSGRVWLQILSVIGDLQAMIAEHEKDRTAFEKWVKDERAAIARDREQLRRDAARPAKTRRIHRFW